MCVLFCTLVYACKYIAHIIKMGKVPSAFFVTGRLINLDFDPLMMGLIVR